MKGDFSRISFDPQNHFSRVLLQQGRVTLDADPNEQSAILLHYLRTLARDLIGPYGGPIDNLGFVLSVDSKVKPYALNIAAGRYYVDGILCENDGCDYATQPDFVPALPDGNGQGGDALLTQLKSPNAQQIFWVYLDVWERHISSVEDDRIREVALNGPDTCTRSKVVWQVKAQSVEAIVATLKKKKDVIDQKISKTTDPAERARLQAQSDQLAQDIQNLQLSDDPINNCKAPFDVLDGLSDAQMTAQLDPGQQIKDPCVISPDARYRGAENQLYRVEIHRTGAAGSATFKWSRDNGSIATSWFGTEGTDLLVANVRGFEVGNWVELSDDANDLLGQPGTLVKLVGVGPGKLTIDSAADAASPPDVTKLTHAKVRRWDQTQNDDIDLTDGAILIDVNAEKPNWIDLEDGVQVQFAPGGTYRSGDYWLIPARVATGSIDWPHTAGTDGSTTWQPRPPQGVEHHYAPLGFLSWSEPGSAGGGFSITPCNCRLWPTNSCSSLRGNLVDRVAIDRLGSNVVPSQPKPPIRPVAAKRARATKSAKPK
jgi:hypothetical protein